MTEFPNSKPARGCPPAAMTPRRQAMKKLGLAALAIALVPAACQAPLRSAHADRKWQLHRTCTVINTKGDDAGMLELDDVRELQKFIPALKKCSAFWQCVEDREAGKVKHCYENDRRWRIQ